jgi:hypothetical protein
MILGRYRQQPGERRKRGIDYSDFLETGEVITDVEATVTPTTDTPLVIDGIVIDPDGTEFAYFTSGGEDGISYSVEFAISTNGNQIKRDTVDFDIEEDE